jgi:hypothetical protein
LEVVAQEHGNRAAGRKCDVNEPKPVTAEKVERISKKKSAFRGKKVQVTTCGHRTVSVCFEYAEKWMEMLQFEARSTLFRLASSKLVIDVKAFCCHTGPHHEASYGDSTETAGSTRGKAGRFPEI